MSATIQLKYFNTIYLKHPPVPMLSKSSSDINYALSSSYDGLPWYHSNVTWGGPAWIDPKPNNASTVQGPSTNAYTLDDYITSAANGAHWVSEESRIRGGYNNAIMDLSPRAFLVEKENKVRLRENTMIYSGVFNSRTGVNQSNVFAAGTDITRSVDRNLGSIQKLFAMDNSLTIFQENKVSNALIDKDAIYTQEGQPLTTASNVVIGAITPYVGDYGISKNPESFASFGFRRYFSDKYRNVIMRLSRDGLTPISEYGMKDYFRDKLRLVSDYRRAQLTASWVISDQYPGVPNPNPTIKPPSTYLTLGDFINENGSQDITIGAGVSIYQAAGPVQVSFLQPCDSQGNPQGTSGTGYSAGVSYLTAGGSGSGLAFEVTVAGPNGEITGATLSGLTTGYSGSGYKLGDVIEVLGGGGSTGYLVIDDLNNGIQDDGSGVWTNLDHFVTGVSYSANSEPSLVMTTGGNYGFIGQDGQEYEAYGIRFIEYKKDQICGGYDVHKGNYVISLKRESLSKTLNEISDYRSNPNGNYSTLAFDENVKGWTTFYTFRPGYLFNLKNVFYTTKENQLYSHYTDLQSVNTFYNNKQPSLIEFIFNPQPSINKNFKTINYEGSNGWQVSYIRSSDTGPLTGLNINYFDSSSGIKSYNRTEEPSILERSSFKLKEGKYVAEIVNQSSQRPGEVIFGEDMSGLKGYYITVAITTDEFTDPQSRKEIFAVSSEFVMSSK